MKFILLLMFTTIGNEMWDSFSNGFFENKTIQELKMNILKREMKQDISQQYLANQEGTRVNNEPRG